jgi:hypothetical protein
MCPSKNETAEKLLASYLSGVNKSLENSNGGLLTELKAHVDNTVLKSVESFSKEFATKVVEKSAEKTAVIEKQLQEISTRVDKIEKVEGTSSSQEPDPKATIRKKDESTFGMKDRFKAVLAGRNNTK